MSNKTPDKKTINGFYRVFIFSIACFWKTIFNPKFANESYLLSQRLKQPALEIQEEEAEITEKSEEASETVEAESEESAPLVSPSKKSLAEEEVAIEEEAFLEVNGLQFLALLQKTGRFVDFLKQDVTGFSNAEVGEAARIVHEGCAQVLNQYFEIETISSEEEGTHIVLEAGFDCSQFRISGKVQGKPPYRGELLHAGWKVTSVQLPHLTRSDSLEILCPAEVEIV